MRLIHIINLINKIYILTSEMEINNSETPSIVNHSLLNDKIEVQYSMVLILKYQITHQKKILKFTKIMKNFLTL